MMRDYLAKLSILSQLSAYYQPLRLPDPNTEHVRIRVDMPKTPESLPTDNVDYRNGKRIFYGACHTNPAYMGDPGEDR